MSQEVDCMNRERIAYRNGLRAALRAIESVPQGNKGNLDLIARRRAISAVHALSGNSLQWGGIFAEVGPDPTEPSLVRNPRETKRLRWLE